MSITPSTLDAKITLLQQQRDQTIAALNQVLGAIAVCEQMKQEELEAQLKEAEAKAAEDEVRAQKAIEEFKQVAIAVGQHNPVGVTVVPNIYKDVLTAEEEEAARKKMEDEHPT